MGQSNAALVIREQSVELVTLKGSAIAAAERVPLDSRDIAQLTAAIERLLGMAKLQSPKLAVAIATQDALVRFFTIPPIPKSEWEQAVQFEARKYIPFKTDSLVWDYRVTQTSGAAGLEVTFVAIQRDGFQRILSALDAAHVRPVTIEPASLSISRLAPVVKRAEAGEFVCLLDVEGDMAHLAIVKDRLPYFARDINLTVRVGGAATEHAAEPDTSAAPAAGVDPRVQRLLSELSVSVDFFTHEYQPATIAKIILLGEESLVTPWIAWLAEQLSCPVESGRAWVDQHVKGQPSLGFAAAIGAARGSTDSGAGSLNFLKRGQVKAVPGGSKAKGPALVGATDWKNLPLSPVQIGVTVAGALALLAGCWGLGRIELQAAQRELNGLLQSPAAVPAKLDGLATEGLQEIQGATQAYLTQLTQEVDGRVSLAEKLDALVRQLPDGVWLTGLTYADQPAGIGSGRDQRLAVRGSCFLGDRVLETAAIQELEDRVRKEPELFKGFHSARVGEMRIEEDGARKLAYHAFRLDCSSETTQ